VAPQRNREGWAAEQAAASGLAAQDSDDAAPGGE